MIKQGIQSKRQKKTFFNHLKTQRSEMKYLGQMKSQSTTKKGKRMSWGLFECLHSSLKTLLSTSKKRLSSMERGWKHIFDPFG